MSKVAVATTSALAADSARKIVAAGGNAIDCAIGTAITSMNTEPGVCSFSGGAYVTVWAANHAPVTFDGIHVVPGLGLDSHTCGHAATEIQIEYGGGMSTIVGPGSVAVPGALAAFELAWKKFGSVDWRELFQPAVDVTRQGFPLPAACHYYLRYTGSAIFDRSDEGFGALHDADGALLAAGDTIIVPHLADSLEAIGNGGARVFYEGELARALSEHVISAGGALTMRDLEQYEAIEREALIADVEAWRIATNPPPAVGGAIVTAMLLACAKMPSTRWDRASLDTLIRVHRACLDFRRTCIDVADDVGTEAAKLIDAARGGRLVANGMSSSTVHTSAVDDSGNSCAITASAGYGSGEMPTGTGLWLNNGLGEIELIRHSSGAGVPGTRLPSNMAPTVARSDNKVLAIGSPGADRITSAIHQVLVNVLEFGMPLADAVAHPRLHVDMSGASDRLAAEAGLDLPDTDLPIHIFPELNMYFGGVGTASFDKNVGFEVASDPRREGGTVICGA